MLTSRLRVGVWRCSNANQADTLVPVWLPTLPTAVDANEAHGQSITVFLRWVFLQVDPYFRLGEVQKERKKEKCPHYQPLGFVLCSHLRGHWFIGTRLSISFETLSKDLLILNLASFAAGLSCSRLTYTRFSADSRSSLTKNLAQSSPLFARHMHVRDSNFTQSDVLANTKNGTQPHQLWQSGFQAVRIRTSCAFWGRSTGNTKNGTQPHQIGQTGCDR